MCPRQVKICGKTIKIRKKDLESDHGQFVLDESTIYLSTDPKHEKEQWSTLLHELVHATLSICGVAEVLGDEKEEAVCRALENLAPILALRKKS